MAVRCRSYAWLFHVIFCSDKPVRAYAIGFFCSRWSWRCLLLFCLRGFVLRCALLISRVDLLMSFFSIGCPLIFVDPVWFFHCTFESIVHSAALYWLVLVFVVWFLLLGFLVRSSLLWNSPLVYRPSVLYLRCYCIIGKVVVLLIGCLLVFNRLSSCGFLGLIECCSGLIWTCCLAGFFFFVSSIWSYLRILHILCFFGKHVISGFFLLARINLPTRSCVRLRTMLLYVPPLLRELLCMYGYCSLFAVVGMFTLFVRSIFRLWTDTIFSLSKVGSLLYRLSASGQWTLIVLGTPLAFWCAVWFSALFWAVYCLFGLVELVFVVSFWCVRKAPTSMHWRSSSSDGLLTLLSSATYRSGATFRSRCWCCGSI